jgi:Rrf2 family protein
MDLNTKGRYAVMAMADLARHGGDGAVPLTEIAERQQISLAYLEQLFQKLRRAGIVESERGRLGGYRLARDMGVITIAEVMAAVEEPFVMTRCQGHGTSGCVAGNRCLTHDLWDALGDHIAGFLGSVSLQDVLEGQLGGNRRVPGAGIGAAAE